MPRIFSKRKQARIIWVGNPFFAPALKDSGWDLCCLDFLPGQYFNWNSLREKTGLEADDVLVLADKSLPPAILGVEDFPCLTVFYSVDSHIHSWHPLYAQAFDLCLISLKDHLKNFTGKRLGPEQLIWMPPFLIPRPIGPDDPENQKQKQWDLLFVGNIDPAINPERAAFMHKLKDSLPGFHYCFGDYHKLYPKARLVLNHSISGDLNFRVMEALGCGVCLLTPRIGHGLEELFVNGQDLFLFDQEAPSDLVKLVERLLADSDLRLCVARSGFRKVAERHLAAHRAGDFGARLTALRQSGADQELIQGRLRESANLRRNVLRIMYLLLAESLSDYPQLREAYLAVSAKSGYSSCNIG